MAEKDNGKTIDEFIEEEIILDENEKQDETELNDEKNKKTPKSKITDDSKKIKKLEKELLKIKEKEAEYLNGLHRTMAEFDNFKKRTQKEKEGLYKEAVSDVVNKFLPVIDSIDGALKACNVSSEENVLDGLILVGKKIAEVLYQMEVIEIPSEGEEFNPNLHHAIMHIEDEKIDENTIVEVFQKGYQYKEKVIRPSMVKVAN